MPVAILAWIPDLRSGPTLHRSVFANRCSERKLCIADPSGSHLLLDKASQIPGRIPGQNIEFNIHNLNLLSPHPYVGHLT